MYFYLKSIQFLTNMQKLNPHKILKIIINNSKQNRLYGIAIFWVLESEAIDCSSSEPLDWYGQSKDLEKLQFPSLPRFWNANRYWEFIVQSFSMTRQWISFHLLIFTFLASNVLHLASNPGCIVGGMPLKSALTVFWSRGWQLRRPRLVYYCLRKLKEQLMRQWSLL